MNKVNNIYVTSFSLLLLFSIFSLLQINNHINQYFLGVDIGDARLYLDAFYNKELNLNEDLGYTIFLTWLGGVVGDGWLKTVFFIQSLLPLFATFYLCRVLEKNGLNFNFSAVIFAATLWPFSIVFFADILKDSLIQALIIFFVADTIRHKKNKFIFFIKFLISSILLFFLRPEFGILPLIIITAFYIFNTLFHKKNTKYSKIFLFRSLFFILFGLISLALIVDLPNFATGRMGILSYGGNFTTFIYGRSISDSIMYLPIYFGIFYLHPIGIPTGLSSMAVFINNITIIILVIFALNRYSIIRNASKNGIANMQYLIYISGFFIFLHFILALPVIIDSGGISVRHRLPSLFFLLIPLILLSGVRIIVLSLIFAFTLPLFIFI